MSIAYRWIHRVWYDGALTGLLLLPLSGIYWFVTVIRRALYRFGLMTVHKVDVPVIVVGNITAGGTGKTPSVLWLVEALKSRGYSPGIVSRGYGGSHAGRSMRVDGVSSASVVGDEPVLLARRAACPVVVDADRVRAAEMLIEDGVDVVVADDGLQHLRLYRDYEICVVDGVRGLGNGRLLPSGPLRESAARLRSVDLVLANGAADNSELEFDAIGFELVGSDATRLNGSGARPLAGFKDTTVHAVAGIGNPGRFFDLLRSYGIQVIEHSMVDHAQISMSALEFGDDFEVFMTEKDAVKLPHGVSNKFWYIPVDLMMSSETSSRLIDSIDACLKNVGGNT